MGAAGQYTAAASRSPHGERGLKFKFIIEDFLPLKSLPARGAWVEMTVTGAKFLQAKSLPARGAWVEMGKIFPRAMLENVAPRTGSVG